MKEQCPDCGAGLRRYHAQPDIHDRFCQNCATAFKRSDADEWLANQETIADLLAALEMIAGVRQPADNLMSNEDIARAAIAKAHNKEKLL